MPQKPRYTWRIRTISLALLWLFFLTAYLGMGNFMLTIPLIRADLSLSYTQTGLAMGAGAAGYILCQGLGCRLDARIGPRKLLTVILLLSAAFLSLTGLVTSLAMLLAVRALSGGAIALHPPATWACMSAWIPRNELTRAHTTTLTSATLSGVLMPLPIAALLSVTTWRHSFSATALLTVLLACFVWKNLRDKPEEHPRITPEELEEIRQGTRPVADMVRPATIRTLRILARPGVLLLCLVSFFQTAATWGYIAWTAFYLVDVRGLSVIAMCLKMPIIFSAALVGTILSSSICEKIFRRRVRIYMAALWVAGAIFFFHAQAASSVDASVSFLALAAAFGCFMHTTVFWALPRGILPPSPYARSVPLIVNAGQFGALLGITSLGWVSDNSVNGVDSAFLIIQACLMIAAALVLFVPRRNLFHT